MSKAPFGPRLILAPTGPLSLEMRDDVRRFADASKRGISRAIQAGATKPLLVVATSTCVRDAKKFKAYERAVEVAALGALQQSYIPLEAVEWMTKKQGQISGIAKLGLAVVGGADTSVETLVRQLNAVESGRIMARDIAGADPERMAPLRAAEYIKQHFIGVPNITVKVITDAEALNKDYPLFAAVARASMNGIINV
jgi:leucyl aminopeptidase